MPSYSARTQDVYRVVESFIKEEGYPPSIREIAAELKCSRTTVKYHLDLLVQEGRIWRRNGAFRGLSLVTRNQKDGVNNSENNP